MGKPGRQLTLRSSLFMALMLSAGCGDQTEVNGESVVEQAGLALKAGPRITRAEVMARAAIWANDPRDYSQSRYDPETGYRQDCSGYASMALHLPESGSTVSLPDVAYLIEKDNLKAGDLVMKGGPGTGGNNGHVIIFEKWANDQHSQYWAYEQTSPNTMHRIKNYPAPPYYPYRYKNIQDGASLRSDVNGDGKADLVSLHSSGTAFTWSGAANGYFLNAVTSFAGTMSPALFDKSGHYPVDVADVNGDGRADLVTVRSDGYAVVYPGESNGTFGKEVPSFAGTLTLSEVNGQGYYPVAAADVNGDGLADLVTTNTNGTAYVFPGQNNLTFGRGIESFAGTLGSAIYDGVGYYPVDVADVTGDGRADLVTVHSDGNAYVFPGQADGTFGKAAVSFSGTMHPSLFDGRGFEPVGVADVNGDGKADLVAAHDNGMVYVYPGTNTGVFSTRTESFCNTMNSSLFDNQGFEIIGLLDVTGDGLADLVALNSGTAKVYPGTKAGKFGSGIQNFHGTLDSSRFDKIGHEFVSERILARRRGCASSGCR